MRLFDRVVELKVGNTDITGLDIAFEIEKDLSPEPNPCHVEIYNLSAANRSILSKYGHVPVLLKAGFKDHVGVIFQGDMLSCTHAKEGPTWKTVLANGDGAKAIQSARIKKSFAKGTPVKDIIKEIAHQLNLPCDGVFKQLEGLGEKIARGFCMNGSAMDALSRILKLHGLGVSVQNNSLQLLKQDEALVGKAISLSADSGLKSSPQIGSDKMLNVQSVLMPGLIPGMQIHIQSSVFTGFAVLQSVKFSGANFGDEWEAELSMLAKVM